MFLPSNQFTLKNVDQEQALLYSTLTELHDNIILYQRNL